MKSNKLIFFIGLLLNTAIPLFGQMIVGNDTLYGNEWIDYNKSYFKIKVASDGVYRLDANQLTTVGFFSGSTIPQGANLQLWRNGKQIPLFVSTTGSFSNSDYLAFYGTKNRGEIDKFLYEDTTHQVNPEYSLFTDTSAYYLTWEMSVVNPLLTTSIPNDLTNLPPKEVYCWYQQDVEWHEALSLGIDLDGIGGTASKYDLGEGFVKSVNTNDQTFNINLPDRYLTNNDSVYFTIKYLAGKGYHNTEIKINNTTYAVDTFSGWAVKTFNINVPIQATAATTPVRLLGSASTDDKYRFAILAAKYQHTFGFNNVTFSIFKVNPSAQRQYLEITNFNTGTAAPDLYDLTNNLFVQTQLAGNIVKVTLPPSTQERTLVLVSQAAYKIPSIEPINFQNFDQNNGGDYIILSHSKLFNDGNGTNYVQEYANYRASSQGGSYTPVVVDIAQVYEQFGYGIRRHDQSIRNFIAWAIKHWESEYLFIIGKGVAYTRFRTLNTTLKDYELVPSFGYPTSDNLLATVPFKDVPELAVGRIAAYTPQMVKVYLDKVKQTEFIYQTAPQTIQDRAWMKSFLHLGGGDQNIQNFIRGRLESLEDIIKNSSFAASVLAYYKNSTNVVQTANSEDVTNRINEGLAWITFFGHSAPNTLDFDIGDPNQYENQGKYPMIYAMGCNTNRLFESASTLSESYVFIENKGAIGFIGSTATTSLSNLAEYGKILYQNLGNNLYSEPIGKIMKQTIEDYPFGGFAGSLVKHNMMLHGDPGMRIFPQQGVDFLVNKAKTKVLPTFVNLQQDSFQLQLTLTNIGYKTIDSIHVSIDQIFPDKSQVQLKKVRLESPVFEQTYSIWLPLVNKATVGTNQLVITVDCDQEVAEKPASAEVNNTENISFSIISNSATPVYPYPFSIVHSPQLVLKASTANMASDPISYFMEIDTTALFNSPLKQSKQLTSNGGLLEWSPQLTLEDSVVYYWRVSIDSALTNGSGFNWETSSFVYLAQGSKGWNQSHFYQFAGDNLTQLDADSALFMLTFAKKISELKVLNASFPPFYWEEATLLLDNFRQFSFWPCSTNNKKETVQVAIISEKSLSFKKNLYNNNVTPNCWEEDLDWFIFDVFSTPERQKLMDTLSSVNDGDYVALFITKNQNGTLFSNQWAADSITTGTNIFQVLEAQGATQIRDMPNNETVYILIYQKDNPNWKGFREVKAATNNNIIQATTVLEGKHSTGYITSPLIGPATNWKTLKWDVENLETSDSISVSIFGVSAQGKDTLLYEGLTKSLPLNFIDANIYPNIKLQYFVSDKVNFTAAQLKYWRVLFDPIPEVALQPEAHFSFYADTIQQGDQLNFSVAVANISQVATDSLLVKYTVTNASNQQQTFSTREQALLPSDSLHANFVFDTKPLIGEHTLTIEVNPDKDQPEMFHFNNVGSTSFYVKADNIKPLLDVTFDGVHIMNGDLVSAKPSILILLKDENTFIPLNDTSLFDIYLKSPDGALKQYYVNGTSMLFYPADTTNLQKKNIATIEWKPTFTQNGDYRLEVRAKDASGNLAGKALYTVDFKVIIENKISNVLNYPNPFTTATQFVFTLTGDRVPDDLSIQIMTVGGEIIRTIQKEELGTLRVGNNRTEFAWNGTDQYGDRLANGVYLYRVLAYIDGKPIEVYENGISDYFKGGFGKMVLLR